MIIKFVTCQVEKDQKQSFSRSQLAWETLSNIDGFGGQFGGWDKSTDQAIIIGVWDSYEHVNDFMTSVHDEIFFSSGQQSTYQQCTVDYFEKVLSIPSLASVVKHQNESILRVAYCREVQDVDRFLRDQRNVWNVHMGRAAGMLGGCVIRSLEDSHYFMVISRWASTEHHEHYVKSIFPKLKNQVMPASYINGLSGCLIQEEHTWEVAPNKRLCRKLFA